MTGYSCLPGRFLLPSAPKDPLSMSYRVLVIAAVLFLALNVGGCRSGANQDYEEVLMPKQTGSVLQRRVQVRSNPEKKSKKKTDKKEKKKETEKPRKPDTEPTATPAPEEESTPPPERFR